MNLNLGMLAALYPFSQWFHDLPATREAEMTLKEGQIRSIPATRPVTIECRCGLLWLTQAGDSRDIILGRHQNHVFARRGKIVVTAMKDSRLRIERSRRDGRLIDESKEIV